MKKAEVIKRKSKQKKKKFDEDTGEPIKEKEDSVIKVTDTSSDLSSMDLSR